MYPSPILGKGSIGFPIQYCEKVLGSPIQYRDRFYRFPSPILGKGSRFPSSVLMKFLWSKVQNWEKVL